MPKDDDGINSGADGHIFVDLTFQRLVDAHYESLYRFAIGLTRQEADACDLTQQTFYQWARKGHQLRDKSKAKSWLYRTLYREYLKMRGNEHRFVCLDGDQVEGDELVDISPSIVDQMDAETLMQALFTLDELYRAPLVLVYLDDHSYKTIAAILDVPVGTVMSRLSRAKDMLRRAFNKQLALQRIVTAEPNPLSANIWNS